MALQQLYYGERLIPDTWTKFLRTFQQEVNPKAALVGGALRDLILVRAVKDLDITVPTEGGVYDGLSLFHFWDALGVFPLPVFPAEYMETGDPHLSGVEELVGIPDLPPVQLLWTKGIANLEEQLNRLDFGICQIGYDGEAVYGTDAFFSDAANMTFTLTSRHSVERSLKRFERLQAKYPGYRLVA